MIIDKCCCLFFFVLLNTTTMASQKLYMILSVAVGELCGSFWLDFVFDFFFFVFHSFLAALLSGQVLAEKFDETTTVQADKSEKNGTIGPCSSGGDTENGCGPLNRQGVFEFVKDANDYSMLFIVFCLAFGVAIFAIIIAAAIKVGTAQKKKDRAEKRRIAAMDESARLHSKIVSHQSHQ